MTAMNADASQPFASADVAAPYVSNAGVREVAAQLGKASRVALFTHTKPDGDAIGAVLALTRVLRHRGLDAWPVFIAPWNQRFDRVLGATPVVHAETEADLDRPELSGVDAVAVLDTGAVAQLGLAAAYIASCGDRVLIIDHHVGGDAHVAPTRLIDTGAAAACEIVARVAVELLELPSAAALPTDVAEPLYLGLATDTGWFKHPNVTPAVFRLAADLLDAGVDHNRLFAVSDMSDPPSRLLLMQRALSSLRLIASGRAAVMMLSDADFTETGSERADASGIIDVPRSVRSVEVSALLYELAPGVTKVSLRSKKSDLSVNVNELAATWGGGGHHHAAGAKLNMPLDDASREVSDRLTEAIDLAQAGAAKTNPTNGHK
jgi:phosphoesterase RecJ-like protein